MQPDFFETAGITEASIPVTGPGSTVWRRIYVLPIGAVSVGDLIAVTAETQFQNNVGYNVEVVSQITILPSATPSEWADPFDNQGVGADYICRSAGENVSPDRHYYQLSRSSTYRVQTAFSQAFILLRGRCRSTLANGASITVPYGYGKISASVWRA